MANAEKMARFKVPPPKDEYRTLGIADKSRGTDQSLVRGSQQSRVVIMVASNRALLLVAY
jgi:hypothetical protein